MLCNPFYAINIAPALCQEHPLMISRTEWIDANVNTIAQIGAERWLTNLLEVLEGNDPTEETAS